MGRMLYYQVAFLRDLITFGGERGRDAVRGVAGGRPAELLSAALVWVENSPSTASFGPRIRGWITYITRYEYYSLILTRLFNFLYTLLCSELDLTEEFSSEHNFANHTYFSSLSL